MVFHAPPYPPDLGPSRRHYHELTELLDRGHRISVLSYGSEDDRRRFAAHFGRRCVRFRFVPLHHSSTSKIARRLWNLVAGRSDLARLLTRGLQQALDEIVASERYDVISFSTTMLGGLKLPEGVPLVGDTHNVEFDNLRRAFEQTRPGPLREYFRLQAALTRHEESTYSRRFDVVCVTSERDRRVLATAVPDARIEVVPNGVDLEAHRPDGGPREAETLVFTGLMSYYPNWHGIRGFINDVFPRVREQVPGARLIVVGADPPPALRRIAGGPIELTGYVPDVRPYLRRATAYVVPLHIGGGTRVKVLQAMAMGLPIVSTPLGCEGLDVQHGRHVLIADCPSAFTAATVRTLRDAALRRALAANGCKHVQRFAWTRVGDRLEKVLTAAAGMRVRKVLPALEYAADSH